MIAILPKPSPKFVRDAKLLAQLQGADTAPEISDERKRLTSVLKTAFESAFGLSQDRLRLANRFFHRLQIGIPPKSGLFDHKSFYQRGGNLVIVSQPYGVIKEELDVWSSECGTIVTRADEWGHYFPGRASLFFVEFTPLAKANLDKRMRSQV